MFNFFTQQKNEILRALRAWKPGEKFSPSGIGEVDRWLEQQNERWAHQQTVFQALLEGISESVAWVSDGGRIRLTNSRFVRRFGEAKRMEDTLRDPKILEALDSVLKASAGTQTSLEISANNRYFKVTFSKLADSALVVFYDQTKLKHAIEDRSQLLSDIAHELRTPLTAIRGFSQTLMEDWDTTKPEDLKSYAEIISRNSERLTTLVNEFLDLTRLESKGFKLHCEDQPFEKMLASVLDQLRHLIEQKQIEIQIDKNLQSLYVDKTLFERALRNILENAIKYSAEKTMIQIRAGKSKDGAWIEVEDQGPGIAPEHIERIFDRFYRVETSRVRHGGNEVGGSGLGLAMVKRIVEAHNGKVEVQSDLGKGSTFRVQLTK